MPNRLARETSPYLQQHAENPVDWYPWGEEALAEASRTGKPILLSVGYSACHWCHVMAHESFEDPAIAGVMNELFVNVKVDREERPDIDQIYQAAQALLTQRSGGWPLTMFLTPDQLPFFGGTYFPNPARYGMPGFGELLKRVRQVYDENRDALREQGMQVAQALSRVQPRREAAPPELDASPLEAAHASLRESYDREHGGFGGAPKFPHAETIELLLRRYAAKGDREALGMATHTLRRMARGGLYDQVGGGFARYSTDAEWAIPHFEKMLYDNAWLLRLYADAWCVTRDPLFERVCVETAEWVIREMQSPQGGYYSSLDADSEGEEGRFYVWTPDEIAGLLTRDELAVASAAFGLDRAPNFEGRHWHLTLAREPREVARMMEITEGDVQVRLDSARRKLRAARDARVWPGRDEKVLASWNALMIAAMAHAGRVLGREAWIDSARRALDFIAAHLWNAGRMLATHKDGKSHLDAYLDDHAFLLAALLEVLQARFDPRRLAWARDVGQALLARFHDEAEGGFFFTAHEHEALIQRPKPGPDNATPSGNGVAALALNRLAFLTGDTRFSEAAARTVALFWPQLQRHPVAFGTLLCALEEQLEPPDMLLVCGAPEAFGPWHEAVRTAYLPRATALFIPPGIGPLPEPLAKPAGDGVNAWLCRGVTCLPPIDTPERLRQALDLPKMPAPNPPPQA